MRKPLLVLFPLVACLAQTSSYPGAIDTDATLYLARDNVQSTLSLPMAPADNVAVVVSGARFAPNMIATICETTAAKTGLCTSWEHVFITAVNGQALTVTRGYAGTAAAAHATGKSVSVLIDAAHQTALKSALIAIETALGANLANIANATPLIAASAYVFAPIQPGGSPGGSLVIGNNTVTLPIVPPGVNGTDLNHRLYVSGGSGTAESCLITGGSGTATATNGQIIINCANTHSGAWSIQSAAGGIPEAIQAAVTAGGGIVSAPAKTISLYAGIHVPSNVSLTGQGEAATTLTIPNGALAANSTWQIAGLPGNYCVVCFDPGTSYQRLRDLTIDANGANQTWFYYTEVFGYNASNVIVDRVTVKNHTISGGTGTSFQFLGHSPLTSNSNNVIINSSNIGIAGCTVPNGGGAFYIEGEGNRVISSYAKNFCDSAFVISVCDHCSVVDSVADVGSGNMATPTFSVEGAQYTEFANDHCIATGANPHRYCVGIASVPTMQSIGTKVIGLIASHTSTDVEIGINNVGFGATTPILDTEIIGLHGEAPSLNGIELGWYVNGLHVRGGYVNGSPGAGVAITSTGTTTQVVQNVYFDGFTVDHAVYGVLAASTNSGPPVLGLKVTNSFLGDTSGSPVMSRSIWLQGGGPVSDVYVVGNTFTGTTANPLFFQNTWATPANAIIFPNYPLGYVAGAVPIGCNASFVGTQAYITDSATVTWGGDPSTGGGSNKVLAFCNGTNWTVAAK